MLCVLYVLQCSTAGLCCCSLRFYSTLPGEHWSAPSLRPNSSDLRSAMVSFPLQRGLADRIQSAPILPAGRVRTAATMKSSPAFLKTKQLFEDDRKFALQQVHAPSCQVTPVHSVQGHKHSQHCSKAAQQTQQHATYSSSSSLSRTHSAASSGNSMADSVSSYHGYAGVNYQSSKQNCTTLNMHRSSLSHGCSCLDVCGDVSGIKDIDAVPNQWGYSLNDYKAIFGEKYVHGCVPWEDEHISKKDRKTFGKLHTRRVQLLQELHGIEQGIRELMQ